MTIKTGSGNKALFTCLATIVLLSACASRGGVGDAPRSDAEAEGIQTRAIRTAPAARPASNDSRPLSQLNTPDAIASREATARRARATATAAPTVADSSAPGLSHFLAVAAANPAPQPRSGAWQKGSKVLVRSGTALHARPSAGSETTALVQDAELELGPQVYNAGGYWWYVSVGNDTGWLSQSDSTR